MPWGYAAVAVGGALISADASKNAAGTQSSAAQQGVGEQQREFNIQQKNLAPYLSTGQAALSQLQTGLGIQNQAGTPDWNAYLRDNPDVAAAGVDPQTHYEQSGKFEGRALPLTQSNASDPNFGSLSKQFTFDPTNDAGYQAGLTSGFQGINNSAAAKGSALSGATLKELLAYGQNYAGTQQQIDFNQFNTQQTNQFNRLAAAAGIGQQAVNQSNAAGQNSTNAITGLQTGAANATAAGQVGQANAYTGALNTGANNYLLSSIFKGSGGGSLDTNYQSNYDFQNQQNPSLSQLATTD